MNAAAADPPPETKTPGFSFDAKLLGVLLIAVVLRGGALLALGDELNHDRDLYLGIAENLAEGNGFSTPGTTDPTAYRPPLYPIVLAAMRWAGGGTLAVGILHVVLSTSTVALTWHVGRTLGLGRGAVVAAGLVAVDPILVQYTALPMTETFCTFLVMLLLAVSPEQGSGRNASLETRNPAFAKAGFHAFIIGILFGLCALCRPTVWAFGALAVVWWLAANLKKPGFFFKGGLLNQGKHSLQEKPGFEEKARLRRPALAAVRCGWLLLSVAVTVSPWVVRNALVFGSPKLTTTHGGYTLLLGNNPVFYREVVAKPWGTVWSGDSLERWQRSVEEEMRSSRPRPIGEVERDRWMTRRAMRHIAGQPDDFLAACWLRLLRFWNVAPLGSAVEPLREALAHRSGSAAFAESAVTLVRWGIALLYVAVTVGMVVGLVRIRKREWPRWMPLVLLIAAFTLVHLVYWTNTRMRAPVVPAIALLAARGFAREMREE